MEWNVIEGEVDQIRFDCSVDIFSPRALWEVKCSNTISIEHKIQLVLYSWLCELMGFPKEEYNIFNIKTGEHLALVMDFEKVNAARFAEIGRV